MAGKVTVEIQPLGKKLLVNKGTSLTDVLHEFEVEFPCGGKGVCGNCRIRLLAGELPADARQRERLRKLKLGPDWRLACFCTVNTDIVVEVSQWDSIILADNTSFSFIPSEGHGIAVDVGTTTLVAQLLDLHNGTVLDVATAINPQVRFGADVISRIQSGLEGNASAMGNLIREKTGEMIAQLCRGKKLDLKKVVMVGNTAMHHIFSALDLSPLSYYPFESQWLDMRTFSASETGWDCPESTRIKFYPSIGSFVGSDILAGIAATRMLHRSGFSILIDLGTNGEIVAGNKNGVLCASTAAGPAFEGACISCGMRATTGAISSVFTDGGKFKCKVIGNVTPKGICGSGLVDAMAELIENDMLGEFGEVFSGEERIELAHPVAITQNDIREFQLAKAAISTGLEILLNKLGITYNEIDQVFIAGGFGNYLNPDNMVKTGIVETNPKKIVKVGNTALIGAKMFLFQDEGTTLGMLEKIRHINLESERNFQDIYISKLQLY